MSIQEHFDQMRTIQRTILNYLEKEDVLEEFYENLIQIFQEKKINENKLKFESVLHLLSIISHNHHRELKFFKKIEKILLFFKNDFQKFYTNNSILNIFKGNKRILLFLIKEQILTVDKTIAMIFENDELCKQLNYFEYFYPEIKLFVEKEFKMPENFEEKRIIGENDNYICTLIRKDQIDEFISHVNQKIIDLDSHIDSSIFETNKFLFKKKPSLIEYAAFCGSIQIFKYLFLKVIDINFDNILIYAIHGDNIELILILIERLNEPDNESLMKFVIESIKCHHIHFTNYIFDNFPLDYKQKSNKIVHNSLKYFNFVFLEEKFNYQDYIYEFCKYDHAIIFDIINSSSRIDVNFTKI